MVAGHIVVPPADPNGSGRSGPIDEPARLMDEMKYTADHLPDVRLFAATCARHAGLDEETVGDFVIAVNEIATNAVRYGSPLARVRLWTSDGGLFAEVHDSGRWEPDSTPGRSPPGPWAEGGMGLWVTRQICSTLDIESGPAGTIVRLRFPLR